MNNRFDFVVVGGGPAGLAAALTLLNTGADICLVEKKKYPRDKLCGGLVTAKTYDALVRLCGDDVNEIMARSQIESVCDMTMYFEDEPLCRAVSAEPYRLVSRREFDSSLAELFVRRGGKIAEETEFTGIDTEKCLLETSRGIIGYKTLIAADGVHSRIRRACGKSLDKTAFCLEARIPRPPEYTEKSICIYLGVIKSGYGWVFPSGDCLNVGIIGQYEKAIDYKKKYTDFLRICGLPSDIEPRGAFVPYGGCLSNPGQKNILFCGDAAGFVDPIFGEGLYFALDSGINAGCAALLPHPAAAYKRGVSDIIKTVRQGELAKSFFFRTPVQKLFRDKMRGKNDFLAYYADNMISRYNFPYSSLLTMIKQYKNTK